MRSYALAAAALAVPLALGAQSDTTTTGAIPIATPIGANAAADTAMRIVFGGFVDGYYTYDFNRPSNFDRAFTTQPARHNEFNVNLAFVEARVSSDRMRGRLALQYGTSVQSNYAGEPRNGTVSGPDASRFLQEATVGYRLSPRVWVDGGIQLSHIGSESFISRDNLVYTRSLMADYSPYYQSGVRVSVQATSKLAASLHVVNGWQVISESNGDKAIGARLDYAATRSMTLSAYNLIGNEAADSLDSQLRIFQGASVKFAPVNSAFTLLGTADYGTQAGAEGQRRRNWYGAALVGRLLVAPAVAIVGRVERYDDRDQVIIVTGVDGQGFRTNGASAGVDVTEGRFLWRTELRGFSGKYALYPDRSGSTSKSNAFVVSSLALTF